MWNRIYAPLLVCVCIFQVYADQSETNVSQVCRDADDLLKSNNDLISLFGDMTTRYELNKTVDTQDDPVHITVSKDYTGLMGRNYNKIKSICEDDFGYDLCSVISWTNRMEEVGNIPALPVDTIPVKREVIEILKPVCFPKSCREDQISILDPYPADCDPLIGDCEISSYRVTCPRGRVASGDKANCASDIIPNGSPIYTRINFMENTMKTSCTAELAGSNSLYCQVDYGEFELETSTDYSNGRESADEFAPYQSTCALNGGLICNTDLTASYKFENGVVGDLFLSESYFQIPLCLPSDCMDESDKQTIAVETFRDYTFDSRIVADCAEGECDVSVTNITCSEPEINMTLPPTPSPQSDDDALPAKIDLLSSTCRAADDSIKSDGTIEAALSEYGLKMEVNKTRTSQSDPVDILATQDYSGTTGRNFEKIKEICEVDNGFDLCEVKTITSHSETIGNLPFLPLEMEAIPVTRKVTEIAKPVCFPKTCTDDQVNVLDPMPGNCDVLNPSSDCEIISYEVTCPERNVTNTTNCELDAFQPGNPIFPRLGALKTTVLSTCATLVAGGQSESCSLEYGSFEVDTMSDFATHRQQIEEFATYESACLTAGGQICDADLTAAYVLPNGSLGDLVLTENYLQLPLCIAPQCSDGDDEQNAVIDSFRKFTTNSFTLPNCDEDVCNVILYSASCYGSA